jgi:N-acyl-D-amino-acid deacylase
VRSASPRHIRLRTPAPHFTTAIMNDEEAEVAALLRNDQLLFGLSDAGAHCNQLCDAGAPTYLLGHWCRELGAISLEQAVWRLTGHPARLFGLEDRGRIAEGMVADLVAFDPATVGSRRLERRDDFPGSSSRLVIDSVGIELSR